MSDERTGGEWIVEVLGAQGVDRVFGIPGVHNLAIYDALLRQGAVAHTLTRHEQGAAFMADGYARSSGRIGVVLTTTGPGATNTLTPLAESYAGSIPVLVVMSDIPSHLVGRGVGALHEVVNQIECFRPVCRWAEVVTDGGDLIGHLQGAFDILRTGRPGPVALSVPTDLLLARIPGRLPPAGGGRRPPCHVEDVAEAARLLGSARRPLIIAGGGVIAADATEALAALARRLGAPVITTVMGRGAVPDSDPLWQGVLPDRRATEDAIRAADVILAVGCRFAHRSTQGLLLTLSFAPDQALIHLDLDATVIGKLFKPRLGVVGDARDGLGRLAAALGPGPPGDGWARDRLADLRAAARARVPAPAAAFMRIVRDELARDAIVVNDQTGIGYWMEWHFPVWAPRTFLYPVGSATLGYAVPAAVGAKLANPGRQVVAVVGDGGFLFSVQELATAVRYRLAVVFVVLNDGQYGAIRYLQERMFGRTGEFELTNPDFPALARAFGAAGERVEALGELGPALARALGRPGPTVLEVPMAVDPPWEL